MKKIASFLWPFLLVFLAFGFMVKYKDLDGPKANYEFEKYIESINGTDDNRRADTDNEDNPDNAEED